MDCKTLDLSTCYRCGEVLNMDEGIAVYILGTPRLLCRGCAGKACQIFSPCPGDRIKRAPIADAITKGELLMNGLKDIVTRWLNLSMNYGTLHIILAQDNFVVNAKAQQDDVKMTLCSLMMMERSSHYVKNVGKD